MAAASTSAPNAPAAVAVEEAEKMDEDKEHPDLDRLHGMGFEVEMLKWLIKAHVEGTELRSLFFDISMDMDVDEIACVEAVRLLGRISRPQRELACAQMVQLLFQKKDMPKAEETDRLITKIIIKAYQEEVITFLQACELLISSIDLAMTSIPIDPKKIDFMTAKLHELDYKGMRNIMKMFVENFAKIPPHMTDLQRLQILPVENLFLELIDRKKNHAPALFIITEITRMSSNSSAFMLPRIARKITEVVASFRPLAEITTMIARTWMFPITAHINFNVILQTWKLSDVTSTRLHLKGHLPFNNESLGPQTYLQYILLKQPRNQDVIPFLVRPSTICASPKLQCDDILPVLILESMRAMENTELTLECDENQYTWRQIAHLFISCLYSNHASFNRILSKLHTMLKSHNFRVARAELMWLILQFVAIRIDDLTEEDMVGVEELYNLLYEDEPTWSGCGTDFHRMSRFFGPAAIWIQFEKRASGSVKVPPVPENLKGFVSQIQQPMPYSNQGFPTPIDALVAVAGNAFTSNEKIFQERVINVIRPMLDTPTSDEPWLLPFHRRATCRISSLDIQLLDAFTFRAKDNMIRYLLDTLNAFAAASGTRLPSPACIDTLVRIAMTLEYQFGILPIHRMLYGPKNVTNVDLLYMITEMLNYRLVGCRVPVLNRCALIQHVYALMGQVLNPSTAMQSSIPTTRNNWPLNQLYMAFEQLIMRHALWVPPNELAPLNTSLLTIRCHDSGAFARALTHPDYFTVNNPDPQSPSPWICPEITRMIALSVARSIKIIGDTINTEFITLLQAHRWGSSSLRWFPQTLLNSIGQQPDHMDEAVEMDRMQSARQAYSTYMNIQDSQQRYDFLTQQCGKTQFTGIVIIFLTFWESSCGGNTYQSVNRVGHIPYFYRFRDVLSIASMSFLRFLEHLNSKEYIANVNMLVDFLNNWLVNLNAIDDRMLTNVTNVLNDLVFTYGMIPFERLLLAMVMHPFEIAAIRCSLAILHSLLANSKELQNRVQFLTQSLVQHHMTVHMKSDSHFMKLTEYYNNVFPHTRLSYNDQFRRISGQHHHSQESIQELTDHYLPVYYGNLADNVLPIADALFQRSLEVNIDQPNLHMFLQFFAPCYKFHPQPSNFVYSTLFCLDQVCHTNHARQFALTILKAAEEKSMGRDREQILTNSFTKDNHQSQEPIDFCEQLVTRVIEACVYVHVTPPFIVRDWRFAEHSPAAQALFGACIELMASPHNASVTARALIDIALRRSPTGKPYEVVNAVALILTALPHSFQVVLLEQLRLTVASDELKHGEPSKTCFDPYSDQLFLFGENHLISMLALAHAYWQHAGVGMITELFEFIRDKLADIVETESQLIYVIRIIVPFLQKLNDFKERAKNTQDLVVVIYKMLRRVVELRERAPLRYEDTICDVLYHAKYMFVGDAVKTEAEMTIQQLNPSMQEKLKFLLSSQPSDHPTTVTTTTTTTASMPAPAVTTATTMSSIPSISSDVSTSSSFPNLLAQHQNPSILSSSSSEPPSLMPVSSLQNMMPPATSMPMMNTTTAGSTSMMIPPSSMFSQSGQHGAGMMMNPPAMSMGGGAMNPMMGFPGSGHHVPR
ncbi:hypothetical protein QR680_007050 [Steinernema hermaphroditum]|uniref:Mediator of RNA polymerase II transcription subunit 23 n=1 Tax=Steinernema hermaphroditum TaxID=289476 RepID=A0AA39HXG3_9BILA|nr:hypothetical protein QR680_007050 [Steinernema hermaphroditum]